MSREHFESYWIAQESSVDYWQPVRQRQRTPSITDGIDDLLNCLDPRKRRGMIAWLSVGYYDGWRPGRQEIADLVAVELGLLSVDAFVHRKRRRRTDPTSVTDITPIITQRPRR
jgi:hypothetical protein